MKHDETSDQSGEPDLTELWRGVGEEFTSLGRVLRDRYRSSSDDVAANDSTTSGWAAPSAADRIDESSSHAPSDGGMSDELRQAVDQFVEASKTFADRVGSITGDDEVKGQTRRAATNVREALDATFSHLGDDLRRVVASRRSKGSPGTE